MLPQYFIKLRLENNAPEVEDLSPIELREMRASMAAVPPEHQVQINHINEIHKKVKLKLEDFSLEIPILYGGSVNPSNSKDILESDYVDGVLVGGASTKIDHFEGILNSI